KSKRQVYLTYVDHKILKDDNNNSSSLSLNSSKSTIEIYSNPNLTKRITIYQLAECFSAEYFDSIKNDYQQFMNFYFNSFTIQLFFYENDVEEKKQIVIKHIESLFHEKHQLQPNDTCASPSSQLPATTSVDNILHTFDVQLLVSGHIIPKDHQLVGHVRLYFTTTDLFITQFSCLIADLKQTIINQYSASKKIMCIPYYTIRNYGNRGQIFLIELGKSDHGDGEIHMKCLNSSLARTIHLLVSPVIEERPPVLSSAFQNQLLTLKRMEKSRHIQPPVQLSTSGFIKSRSLLSMASNEQQQKSVVKKRWYKTVNLHSQTLVKPTVDEKVLTLSLYEEQQQQIQPDRNGTDIFPCESINAPNNSEVQQQCSRSSSFPFNLMCHMPKKASPIINDNDKKSSEKPVSVKLIKRSVTFFTRKLSFRKNKRTAHSCSDDSDESNSVLANTIDAKPELSMPTTISNTQHQTLSKPFHTNTHYLQTIDSSNESQQQKFKPIKQINSCLVDKVHCDASLEREYNSHVGVSSTYVEMTSDLTKSIRNNENSNNIEENALSDENRSINENDNESQTSTKLDASVNTTISMPPHVRFAVIVGHTVHLIADEKSLLPNVGPRSFTSPACVMQPFKTQLYLQSKLRNPKLEQTVLSYSYLNSNMNSSGYSSLYKTSQPNSASPSQQSLLLSYGVVTFPSSSDVESNLVIQATQATSMNDFEKRFNSDLNLKSNNYFQQQLRQDSISSGSSTQIGPMVGYDGDEQSIAGKISLPSISSDTASMTTPTLPFTYLIGQPLTTIIDEQASNIYQSTPRHSSINLCHHATLSHIDEEKNCDPYALTEPVLTPSFSSRSQSLKTPFLRSPPSTKNNGNTSTTTMNIYYTDLLFPQQSLDNKESYSNHDSPTLTEDSTNDSSTDQQKIYTDIDFTETNRRTTSPPQSSEISTQFETGDLAPFCL
ncbi:unnamed protein product, partial [Didymodactylos carnosus]